MPPYAKATEKFLRLFSASPNACTFGTPQPTLPGQKKRFKYATEWRGFHPGDVRAHLAGERSIAAIPLLPNNTCWWAAIDLDAGRDFQDAVVAEQRLRIADVSLQLYVFRSKSGGFHLFVFFSKLRSAAQVRCLLKAVASELGFPAAEIFPKQDQLDHATQCGNGINLPFFGGAAGFAEFDPERYAVPPDQWRLAPIEPPSSRQSEGEVGFWTDEALLARLNAWKQFIPGFAFRLGRGGRFEVPCPGNLEFGWLDGAKHESREPLLSPVTQVWVQNGWPVFKCFHAHCDGNCGSPKKTWKDFQEFFDPGRLFHRFDEWVEEQVVEQQGGEFRCRLL
jgi:hypothetical protein